MSCRWCDYVLQYLVGFFLPDAERNGFLCNLNSHFKKYISNLRDYARTFKNECSLMDQKPESKERETKVYLSSLSHDRFGEEE